MKLCPVHWKRAYDDYCAAQLARKLGKEEDYRFFMKRANYYKNLFDPESRLMRGKDTKGSWREPFDKFALSHAGTAGEITRRGMHGSIPGMFCMILMA